MRGARAAVVLGALTFAAALLPSVAFAKHDYAGLVGYAPPPVPCGAGDCNFVGGTGTQQRRMANRTFDEVTISPHVMRVGETFTLTYRNANNPAATQGNCGNIVSNSLLLSTAHPDPTRQVCTFRATSATNVQDNDLGKTGPAYYATDYSSSGDEDYFAITSDKFELAGHVRVAGEAPPSPVTLKIEGGASPENVTTNTAGDYSTILTQGTYTVTPQADGAGPKSRVVDLSTHRRDVDFAIGDEDGDGLIDAWEISGLDKDGDGNVDVDLPAMGADPRHKDVFVEIDAMPGDGIPQAAVNDVVAAFAAGPVPNPDGVDGVTVHVDNGPGSIMDPRTGQTWGALSEADEVPHADIVGSEGPGSRDYHWDEFDALTAGHFSDVRRPAFHYVLSAHDYPVADGTIGIARGIPSSDIMLALDNLCPGHCEKPRRETAVMLMHELGHNLGLHHGGGDEFNYKPNYLSVMNYSFSLKGLLRTNGERVLDYDRFGALSIHEGFLNEQAGFGLDPASPAAQFTTIFWCYNGGDFFSYAQPTTLASAPVDFNCDGKFVAEDDFDITQDKLHTQLDAYRDWEHLVFNGGAIGARNAPPLPATTANSEPTLSQLQAAEAALTAGPGTSPPPGAGPSGNPVLPSNVFSIARKVRRLRDGSVRLTIVVPGPGRIDALATARTGTARAAARRLRTITVARRRVTARRAGRITVRLKPSRAARAVLRRSRKLKAKVLVTYVPTGGVAAKRTRNVLFRPARD